MSKCKWCDAGYRVKRWQRFDGTGSWRMHSWGHWPDTHELEFCAYNSWLSRHWFLAILLALFAADAIWVVLVALKFVSA